MENLFANMGKPKTRGQELTGSLGISEEHEPNMEEIMKYMEEHRLPELFNEILTRILDERP